MTTIELVTIFNEYYSYTEAYDHMTSQGVKHLGWLNDGIAVPTGDFKDVYHTPWSSSSCLYVDPIRRVSYSVDMGD
jgi:hypothetical protein